MLVELAVRDLGVIEELSLVLGGRMTALTGETGAGKTLVVGALGLLLGDRADSDMVRAGASEAVVEGRFERSGDEVILRRVIPVAGRSRAYIDGEMATVSSLAELGAELVELHGQHAHQTLLSTAAQRYALDAFGGIDLAPLRAAQAEVAHIRSLLEESGGDVGARAREMDLLRYQLDEIVAAALGDPDEDASLDSEEDRLADAQAHREALALAHECLTGDDCAIDRLGTALQGLVHRAPFAHLERRLRGLFDEASELAGDLRRASEEVVDDPQRLDEIRRRRQQLVELRRKYGTATLARHEHVVGEPTLAGVMAYGLEVRERLAQLEGHEERAAQLEADLQRARGVLDQEERAVGAARRRAAPRLAEAVQDELRELGMARAQVEVRVGDDDPGNEVEFRLAANPGSSSLPLAKVASGGELARTMLALRLVLSSGTPTMIFDEVDAGIGGEAASAVGRALARLASSRQVLVVTHLPQVAAAADDQVGIVKEQTDRRTVTSARQLDRAQRIVEVARMLSGSPDSEAALRHAQELLDMSAREATVR